MTLKAERCLPEGIETLAHNLPNTLDRVLLGGAKWLYADILHPIEACLRPDSLLLADDARGCPAFVNWMRSDTSDICLCR